MWKISGSFSLFAPRSQSIYYRSQGCIELDGDHSNHRPHRSLTTQVIDHAGLWPHRSSRHWLRGQPHRSSTTKVIFALVSLITGNLSLRLVVSLITGNPSFRLVVLLIIGNPSLRLIVSLIIGNHPSVRATSSRGLEGGGGGAHMAKLGRVELG